MTSAAGILASVGRERPEWAPWLAVVAPALDEGEHQAWARFVPDGAVAPSDAPRLAGATVAIPRALVGRLLTRLSKAASRSGTPQMATLARAADAGPGVLELFRASVCHDADRLTSFAAACGADPDAFQAVAALLAVPFLQSCNLMWGAAATRGWARPYCGVCGSWPAFAEVRGIERSRYYRCGRCGSEWHAHGLSCPYCATTNHRDLVELVPENGGAAAFVEACTRCRGYVKTVNRLQACAPLAVMLEDMKGAALDIAALGQGYRRPAGTGSPLDLTVVERGRVSVLFGGGTS